MPLRPATYALAFAMSACVLPIAPDFQDPPASNNYAPEFVDVDPAAGSIVTATSSGAPAFNIAVEDPNNDDMEVRWISDYPPFSAATSIMETIPVTHPPMGGPVDLPPFQPDCVLHHIASGKTHQLYVIVADRKFLLPGSPPVVDRLPDDAKTNSRSWILNLDCSVPQP